MGFQFGNIAFDVAAIIVLIGLLCVGATRRRVLGLQQGVFFAIVLLTLISAVSSILSYTFSMLPGIRNPELRIQLVAIFKWIFYLCQLAIAPTFTVYVQNVNGVNGAMKQKDHVLMMIPHLIATLIVLTNPITKLIFSVDMRGIYHRGPLVFVVFLVCAYYVLRALFSFLRYREAIPKSQFQPFLVSCIFTLVMAGIQMANNSIRTELLGQALTFFWIMLFIEVGQDEYDSLSGAYNRKRFFQEIQRRRIGGQVYGVLNVRITNLESNLKLLDAVETERFMHKLAHELQSLNRTYQLYSCGTGEFVYLTKHDDYEGFNQLVTDLQKFFSEDFKNDGTKMTLHVMISGGFYPNQLNDENQINHLISVNYGNPLIAIETVVGEELKTLRRGIDIENKLKDALRVHTFEVWFQPIWDRTTEKIVAAEALSRLYDTRHGLISPDEFIPIAEDSGLIEELGLYVLEETCKFIATPEFKELGLSYIEVNLSEYQLLDEEIAFKFLECLSKYQVKPEQINLEITESAAFQGTVQAVRSMDALRTAGFRFSLDDFGTGYSNLSKLLHMDFENIKIDKSLLWDADSDVTRSFLKTIVETAHMLSAHVIQEGVESEEHLSFMKEIGTDMIQGFYFSKPVPAKDFLTFVHGFNLPDEVTFDAEKQDTQAR